MTNALIKKVDALSQQNMTLSEQNLTLTEQSKLMLEKQDELLGMIRDLIDGKDVKEKVKTRLALVPS